MNLRNAIEDLQCLIGAHPGHDVDGNFVTCLNCRKAVRPRWRELR